MQEQVAQQQEQVPQGKVLNTKEIDDLNTLMQDIPQEAQQRIQDMFSTKNYDGIRSMIRSYMAESASRDDIESAKEVAQILMGNPKAMHSARGTSFSLNRLNDILANGSLSDINRMNNALATRLRENGENPYEVIKAGKNTKIELNLSDFLNTMSNKTVRRSHENTLNAKCKYKGQNMSKANRVEKMAANGERFEQRGKKFFGVTSEGDLNATMGEYHYYNYLTQREKETKAQPAPEQAKQEQNAKPVDKPVQQEENSADTMEENTPAYGSDVAENVARMANGGNREAWIDNAAERNANESAEPTPAGPVKESNTEKPQQKKESVKANEQPNKKENLKSIIIGGEKYYIADTPSEPNSKSSKKEKAATQAKKETESRTADEKPANAKENPKTIAVNGETFCFEKPSGVGLPLAMYGNKKSLFGKGAEKKKRIYRTNRQQYGNEVEVRTDDGKTIKVHYALIPADRLIASNKADDTLSKNEAYPQDLQPRDRQRTAMRLQVDSMANSLRPEDLADSRNLNQGAPIVRSDLTVLNGNGRTLAIQRAYQTGKAEEYKQYLLDNAEKLGLDKSRVANMVKCKDVLNTKKGKYERGKSSQPILVRVVDDLSEGDTQSVINSTTGGQRMGSTEQAKVDSKKIKSDTLRKYADDNKGDLTTATNEEFLGDVLKDIVPVNERNAYLTKDGLARAERALFSRAYGDESLLEDFGENLNEEARNMTNALRANAPAIARLQQKIKEGNAHDIGLQKNLVEAVKAIKSAIKQNKPAQSIWEEQTMFDDTAYSPETIEIAKVLHDLRRSGRKLSALMGKLADLNEQHGNPKDEDLFAGEELAEPSLMNDIPIANQYAEELTRAKYSRDAENQLDNQGEKADNEIEANNNDNGEANNNNENDEIKIEFEGDTPVAQAVFNRYLNDGIKQSTRKIISQQIGESIKDFDALQEPATMDKAFFDLPFVRQLRTQYNKHFIQDNPAYKNRFAVRYEYARRCFNNDQRIRAQIVRQARRNAEQVRMASSSRNVVSELDKRERRNIQ